MDWERILKFAMKVATPKEMLRLGILGFGLLGFLQVAGRPDLVGAAPVLGPYVSLGISLACLILLELYSFIQRKYHLEEQEEVARKVNGSLPPPPEG